MKFKNFRNRRVLPSGKVTAEVDIECKYLGIFPIEAVCVVFQECEGGLWRWMKDGTVVDGYDVDNLEKVYKVLEEIHNAK